MGGGGQQPAHDTGAPHSATSTPKYPRGAPHADQLGMMTRAQKYGESETYHICIFSLFSGNRDLVSLERRVPYRRSLIIC